MVGITVYRVVGVTERHADQQFRSLLASLEILAATAVSNAIVLGSFVRDRGEKKRRFRFGSNTGASSLERPPTTPKKKLTNMEWGSDTDLVSGLGMRCSPSLTERRQSGMLARPAPMALPTAEQAKRLTPAPAGLSFQHRQRQASADDMDLDIEKRREPINNFPPDVPTTPRGGMSFFDVGGLLIQNDAQGSSRSNGEPSVRPAPSSSSPYRQPPQSPDSFSYPSPMPSPRTMYQSSPFAASSSKQGSHTLLQDIGGLLPTDPYSQQQQRTYVASPPGSVPPTPPPKDTPRKVRELNLADVLREEEPAPNAHLSCIVPPLRYAPVQQKKWRQGDLQDVGGLLGGGVVAPNHQSGKAREPR